MGVILAVLVVLGLLGFVFLIKRYERSSYRELRAFECGMPSSIKKGPVFSLRFFLLCLVFIILDVETISVLFHPLIVVCEGSDRFFSVLLVLWVFRWLTIWEWVKGGLDWVLYRV